MLTSRTLDRWLYIQQWLHVLLMIYISLLCSAEWIRSDARRTAVSLDLDLESLDGCLENNLREELMVIEGCCFSMENVLKPKEARVVRQKLSDLVCGLHANNDNDTSGSNSSEQSGPANPKCLADSSISEASLPGRDIICAFNFPPRGVGSE